MMLCPIFTRDEPHAVSMEPWGQELVLATKTGEEELEYG
jgi:hypothetical protein